MSHIVTEECIECRYTDCVEVCPVDCFHGGSNFLAIDPEECIDCGLCLPECPVGAIKTQWSLTDTEQVFIEINKNLAAVWPVITKKGNPLPEAENFKGVPNKISLIKWF